MIKRGEIYYIHKQAVDTTVGSEQTPGRPAIIVSNNVNNAFSSTMEIVYLTTKEKKPLPTHVPIMSSAKPSTALCEQITTVSVCRIGSYMGHCSMQEMREINNALAVSVGLRSPRSKDSWFRRLFIK